MGPLPEVFEPGPEGVVDRFLVKLFLDLLLHLGQGAAAGLQNLLQVEDLIPQIGLDHIGELAGREGPDRSALSRIWLFVIAITLHNFPEGMAVGVGFAGGDTSNGRALATGIGIQNIPEGLAVAVSLLSVGYSRWSAFRVGLLTGLAEPVGGLFGALAVSLAEPLMPWALSFAAGAMLFIISDEIIPETHRGGYQTLATFSLLGGFAVMMYLDATLG